MTGKDIENLIKYNIEVIIELIGTLADILDSYNEELLQIGIEEVEEE